MNQVQILTAKKSLEVAEKQGEAVIQLLEVAVDLARDQGETSPKRGIDLKA